MKTKLLIAALLATAATAPLSADVTMWGLTTSRNMVSAEKNPPTDWNTEEGKNIKWVADLGSKSYGNPVVSNGIVWIGTNNEAHKDPAYTKDAGVLMAFRESDGKFLYQRYSDKLPTGRVNDWPGEGMCCSPTIEGDFLYYCTNRCELVCLDISPLVKGTGVPKEVWSLDMIKTLGVFPHNMTSASPLIWKDNVYVITSNGVDETHKHLPAPGAPSIVCVNKTTGKVDKASSGWTSNAPGDRVLHGQWSSAALAEVNGKTLVIAGLGDAWVRRAFDAKTGEIVWQFDANPKNTSYPTTKNEIIATPVIVGTRMYLAIGQDPEHGEGVGHFWCVDITKTGDISKELVDEAATKAADADDALEAAKAAKKGKPNPNSAVLWEYYADAGIEKPKSNQRMNRSMSTVAVTNGLVFSVDLSGYFHCFDADTGKQLWTHDNESAVWGSPVAIDGKIYLCTETGFVRIFEAAKEKKLLAEIEVKEKNKDGEWDSSVLYCTPVFTNNTMYLMTRDKLIAISEKK